MDKTKFQGIYQIDYESFNRLRSVGAKPAPLRAPRNAGASPARTSSKATVQHDLNAGEAELWQINQFLQAEQSARTGVNGILHAKIARDKIRGNRQTIKLYIRSEADSRHDGFIAAFKYKREQQQAIELLRTLAKAYKGASTASTSPQACRSKNDSLENLINQAISPNIESLAACTQAIALTIEDDKFQKSAEQRDQHNKMRSVVGKNLPTRVLNEETMTPESAATELEEYGFKSTEVTAFHKLVDNLVNGREKTDEEHEYQIRRFWMQWVGICELGANNTRKDFRRLICKSPEFQRWNLVAHHLADRIEPKFNLLSYAGFDRVMVPSVEVMVWPELIEAKDKGKTHDLVAEMHEDAYRNRRMEIKKFGSQKLFAAEGCVISADQTKLTPQQRGFLKKSYATIASFEDSCLLTPLFNHTDSTIDQCIAIMIGPFRGASEKGKPLPRVGIFSADPRISGKFNEALEEPGKTGRRKDNPAPGTSTNTRSTFRPVTGLTNSPPTSQPRSLLDNVFEFAAHQVEQFSREVPARPITQPASTLPAFVLPTITLPAIPDSDAENKTSNPEPDGETPEMKGDEPLKVSDQQQVADYSEAMVSRELAERMRLASAQPRKKRNARTVNIEQPTTQVSRVVGIDEPIPQESGKLELQLGIERNDWEPDRPTAFVLTNSAVNCLQSYQMDIMPELDEILESEVFSLLQADGVMFRPASSRSGSREKSYIIPANEIPVDTGNWLINASRPGDTKINDIIGIYTRACKNAAQMNIRRLVVAPCFSLPRSQIFTRNDAYREAIAIMVKTLDDLAAIYPELHIKMVARSEAERLVMQEARQNQKVASS